MYKFISLLLLVFSHQIVVGQSRTFCSVEASGLAAPTVYQVPEGWSPEYDVKFQIVIHQWVTHSARLALTATERQALLTQLNSFFTGSRITFQEKPGSFDYRVSKYLANNYYFSDPNTDEKNAPDAIDVYLVNSIGDGLAYSTIPEDVAEYPLIFERIVIADSVTVRDYVKITQPDNFRWTSGYRYPYSGSTQDYPRTTLSHEMGHVLGLYHTHDNFYGSDLVNNTTCDVRGDLVCDTPAEPNYFSPQYYSGSKLSIGGISDLVWPEGLFTSWQYHNQIYRNGTLINITDPEGNYYTPDLTNLMSYGPPDIKTKFTIGQIYRMRKTIENYKYPKLRATTLNSKQFTVAKEYNTEKLPGEILINTNDRISSGNVAPFQLNTNVSLKPDIKEQNNAASQPVVFKNWN